MTEMSNTPPLPENDNIAPKPPSPWVMLISMLLLVSVLVLTSAMLMHYATEGKEGAARKSFFDFTKLLEKGKELPAKAQVAEKQEKTGNEPPAAMDSKPMEPVPTDSKPAGSSLSDSIIKKFFSGSKDGAVRWPKLKLTGFGLPSKGEVGFAIINGKHIATGGTVNDATLVEILGHGVLVEYKGETKTLIVEVIH